MTYEKRMRLMEVPLDILPSLAIRVEGQREPYLVFYGWADNKNVPQKCGKMTLADACVFT